MNAMQTPAENRPFDAVIFDVGGVLTGSPFTAMAAVARQSSIDPRLFISIAVGAGDADYADGTHPWHRLERGEITVDAFNEATDAMARQHGLDCFPPLPSAEFIESAMGVRPEMINLAQQVRAYGYATAVLTNNVVAWGGWRKLVGVESFDAVIDSCEVGMRKPEARIFALACERLGVEPARCLFLDDMMENVTGAAAFGMQTLLVDATDAARNEVQRLIG